MKAKVSILFYAKRAKTNVNGLVPIYSRITVNGKRIELTTGRFVEFSKWSAEVGKMKGTTDEARSINSQLDILKLKIIDAQMELVHKNVPVISESLKLKLTGSAKRPRMLVPIGIRLFEIVSDLRLYGQSSISFCYPNFSGKETISTFFIFWWDISTATSQT
jgi:hypothetical protein